MNNNKFDDYNFGLEAKDMVNCRHSNSGDISMLFSYSVFQICCEFWICNDQSIIIIMHNCNKFISMANWYHGDE